jgi:hypothetical protein
MNSLEAALALAGRGFHVFPLRVDTKRPRWKGWIDDASTDPDRIRSIFARDISVGVGISTTRWGFEDCNSECFAVDVDLKRGAAPARWLASATEEGLLPATYTQFTPSGGLHLFYTSATPVRCSAGEVAEGIDIRGFHGLIVGAGTTTTAGTYLADLSVAPVAAPIELIELCGKERPRKHKVRPLAADWLDADIDIDAACARAYAYLAQLPLAGEGVRNAECYKAACHLRSLGVPELETYQILAVDFKAQPELGEAEVHEITAKAFRYARGEAGDAAPERIFRQEGAPEVKTPQESTSDTDPADYFNHNHAFVMTGGSGHIMREAKDHKGRDLIQLMSVPTFHALYAGHRFVDGAGKTQQISKMWMGSRHRRDFDGIVFAPKGDVTDRFYNLWRGFTNGFHGEPTQQHRDALASLLEHSLVNFCGGDRMLHKHHMAFYAHMVQRPWEKILVAHVYRGGKGTGKDSFMNIMGGLCPSHYMNTAKRRYLVGDFNSHLENLLLFVLNEAFWAHDVQVQGVLQTLITEREHHIERKGCEPYKVDNLLRMVIMGNSDTMVPTSFDERRYAVFDVGLGRQRQKQFFYDMRVGMESGGYALLLDYLKTFDLTDIDLNEAPNTKGLIDHKRENLDPIHAWMQECLSHGRLIGTSFAGVWPEPPVVDREALRKACISWCREQGGMKYAPSPTVFGRRLTECFGECEAPRRWDGKVQIPQYKLPPLETARRLFDLFIGGQAAPIIDVGPKGES